MKKIHVEISQNDYAQNKKKLKADDLFESITGYIFESLISELYMYRPVPIVCF